MADDKRLQYLKERAYPNFDKYLSEFLKTGKAYGFRKSAMPENAWAELNKLLTAEGVRLIEQTKNGNKFMVLAKTDKRDAFDRARAALAVQRFNEIKQEFPDMPDALISKIVKTYSDPNTEIYTDDIYDMLRHTTAAFHASKQEFLAAAEFAGHSNSQIVAYSYQDWTWSRQAKKKKPGLDRDRKCKYHMSLNVNVTPWITAGTGQSVGRRWW